MNKSLVSIILPTYNRAHCLGRAIESILNQTYEKFEVIIIDNNSEDETDNVISNFNDSRIKLYKIENNGIIAKSRNQGILLAKGDYISFLDSDDWWLPNKLLKSVNQLDAGADIVYHDLWSISSLDKKKKFRKKIPTRKLISPVFQDLLNNSNALCTSSVVVKKNTLNIVGYFSEEPLLIAAEDYDLWLRLSRHTENFIRIPETLGFYWDGGDNTTSEDNTITTINYFRKIYSRELSNDDKEFLPAWMSYELGRAYFKKGLMSKSSFYIRNAIKIDQNFYFNLKAIYTWIISTFMKHKNCFQL